MNTPPRYRKKNNPSDVRIDPTDVEIVRSCFAFKTPEEHARFYVRKKDLPASHEKKILDRIHALIKMGMFIEEGVFMSEILKNAQPATSTAHIEVIGIPTANRSLELARLLESLIPNLTEFGHTPEIVICDDSKPENFTVNATAIKTFSKTYQGTITHLDRDTRLNNVKKMATSLGIDENVCLFALCPAISDIPQYGAARNTLLLHAAGKRILMLDDDVVIHTHTPFNTPPGATSLTVTSSFQNSYSYFDTYEESLDYFPAQACDYLGMHKTWLGRTKHDVISSVNPENIHFDTVPGGCSDALIGTLEGNSGSAERILFTHGGSIGYSWSRYHSNFDASARHIHDLFGASAEQFKRNMQTPFVSKVDNSHTLYYGPACLAVNMAIDASTVLPPFPPFYRGEDNLFGWLASQVCAPHFSLRLPIAVEHKRNHARLRDPDEFGHLTSVAVITRIVMEAATANISSQHDTPGKLTDLGNALVELSTLPIEELEIMILADISKRVYQISSFASFMKSHYAEIAPEWWLNQVADMPTAVNTQTRRITSLPLFSDDPKIDLKKWLHDLGVLFIEWPKMFGSKLEK